MYYKESHVRYTSEGNSVSREIEAIKQNEFDNRLKYENEVARCFDPNIVKVLKKILLKVTKPS